MLVNTFRALHTTSTPLLLANVWDVPSAKISQKNGFKAIGTSSAALAATLGYEDGEELPFSELLFMIDKIASAVSIPLTVDIEAGYSDVPEKTFEHIRSLVKLGVVGINIEDSKVLDGERALINADKFTCFLSEIKDHLNKTNIDVFINVRIDTFLLNVKNTIAETKNRITQYQAAGADGIFIPCITNDTDIKAAVSHTHLPVNVMCMPELTNFTDLTDLGVSRISMGNFIHQQQLQNFENILIDIKATDSFSTLF
ncbi:isocitrate lyase/PEP mutase family protein [Pseudoalteromonas aurantia]|uniref:Isocitrate lyase/phosphoenolpyruvate mutase family protein n=1 Tax=Pseudoalteromonas aurantia 208 TaxID=1314867 RepID=A0ABR9EBB0_9GAMM|nr:isocitrate lyase/phosphoenolpyruvate mutase family protein [Pseudoalteromonas aurantia]MBE0368245.1 hypothetical protein [Pseudoalteromonas aurantia 208]